MPSSVYKLLLMLLVLLAALAACSEPSVAGGGGAGDGFLSRGDAAPIIDVAGAQIRLLGGRVVDGNVQIASASRRGLP